MEQQILRTLPLSVHRQLAPRDLITLVYHVVAPEPLPHWRNIYPSKTPAMFEADLEHLKRHYRPVSYADVAAHFSGKGKLPPDAVLVTFDDGYAECFSVVRPLLLKHGVPCVFFLVSDLIDNGTMFFRSKYSLIAERLLELRPAAIQRLSAFIKSQYGRSLSDRKNITAWLRSLSLSDEAILDAVCAHLDIDLAAALKETRPYLTSEQVRALAADGVTIGAHSRRHPKFQHLHEEAIRHEIIGSIAAVKAWAAQPEIPFAFPFSGQGVSRDLLAGLRHEHAGLGLFFDSQGVRKDEPFIFHRVWADPPADESAASNVDTLLQQAFVENLIWRREYYWSVGLERLRQSGGPDTA